mgnify:FL=1
MSININMGVNPIPTCTVELVNSSFSGNTLTAKFKYTLAAMSGYDWWAYGVKLEYGDSSKLGSSITLKEKSTSQWSAMSGNVTISKSGVNSTPQSFYFRLNSLYPTEGTPGSIGIYTFDVEIAKPSIIINCSDFIIENPFSVRYKTYDNSYKHDLHIDADGAWFKGIYNYSSGSVLQFTDSELLSLYSKIGMPSVLSVIPIKFTLRTWNGDKEVGINSCEVKGRVGGTAKIKIKGKYKNCVPYYRHNGKWKPCVSYVKSFQTWKRGNP